LLDGRAGYFAKLRHFKNLARISIKEKPARTAHSDLKFIATPLMQ
jgi:hypothetical protein